MRDIELTEPAPRGNWRLLALFLLPLLVAGVVLGGTWRPENRSTRVQAAVVNLDKGVEIDKKPVPLGRQLTSELVTAGAPNVTWVLSDAASAEQGRRSGQYAVVVTIPESFSVDAMSYALDDRHARRATIDVERADAGAAVDPTVASLLAEQAARRLSEFLTRSYLDRLYQGMSAQGGQLQAVADAARQIADGNRQLADGLKPASDGVKQLVDGVAAASSGATSLSQGVDAYTGGVDSAAGGAAQLSEGASRLSAGLGDYTAGVASYVDGASQVASGASGLAAGLQQYQSALAGLADPAAAQPVVSANVVPQVLGGAGQTAAGLEPQITAGVLANLPAAPTLPPFGAPGPDPTTVAGLCAQLGVDIAVCSQIYGAGYQQGATDLGADVAAKLGPSMQAGTAQLVSSSVSAGLAAGAEVGVNYAATGGFVAGVTAAQQGLQTADPATGLTLAGGAQALAAGAGQLSSGGAQLKAGGPELAAGASNLAAGAGQLADGLGQAAQGSAQLRDGAAQLAGGLTTAGERGPELTSGMATLADAAGQLADGSTKLADGLAGGAKVPSYTDAERAALVDAVSSPVAAPGLASALSGSPAWPVVVLLGALWLASLAATLVVRAVPRSLPWRNEGAATAVGRVLLPLVALGLAEGLALAVVGAVALGLPFGRWLGLTGILLLSGAVFALVNHALVAWLGTAGRLLSMALLAIGCTVATTAAVPGLLAALGGFGPLAPALGAGRAVVASGGGTRSAILGLLAWGLLAAVAAAVAVVRGRTARVADLPA